MNAHQVQDGTTSSAFGAKRFVSRLNNETRIALFAARLSADKISKCNPALSEGAIIGAYTARLEKWLSKGLNIIDHNLNATRTAREKTVARARFHGYTGIVIVFFEVLLSVCIEHNRSRRSPVAQWALEKVWRQFNGPGRPSSQEALIIRFVPLTSQSFIQEHTAEFGDKPKRSILGTLWEWVRALFR